MNITSINALQYNTSSGLQSLKQTPKVKKQGNMNNNISFGERVGRYTVREGCVLSIVGVIIGATVALLAAPVGALASTLAATGGGLVGGAAGRILGGKAVNNSTVDKENNIFTDSFESHETKIKNN